MLKHLRHTILEAELPIRWSALSNRQFVAVAAIVWKGGPEHEVRARVLWTLLGISWRTPLRMAAFFHALTAEERHDLAAKVCDGFLQDGYILSTPLRTLQVGRRRLHIMHSDQLNHITAEDWGRADTHFLRFLRTRELDHLRVLVVCTWLLDGRVRLEGPHLRWVNRLTEAQLLGVAMQWSKQRKVLEKDNPTVFGKGQAQAGSSKGGWGDVLLSWSGDVFGNYAETRRTPARAFLRRLEQVLSGKAKKNP